MPVARHDEEFIQKVVERCLQQQRGPVGGGRRATGRTDSAGAGTAGERRAGDWPCQCSYLNFGFRSSCRQCGKPRRSATTSGSHGAAANPRRGPAPIGTAAGGGRGAVRGGGVSEGRSFAAVVKQPANRAREFARDLGKGEPHDSKGGEVKSSGGGVPAPARPTWYDLTRGDASTALGADSRQGAADDDQVGDEEGQPQRADGEGTDVAELQRRINQDKAMLKALRKQGRGPGDGAHDGVQANLDALLAQVEAAKPREAGPTGRSLQRAQALLDKAVAARKKLDEDLEAAQAEFQDKLDRFRTSYAEVESRIEHHTAKVADIKAAIGGEAAPGQVRRAKEYVDGVATRLNDVAPRFHDLLARVVSQDPSLQAAAAVIHDEFKEVTGLLLNTGRALGENLNEKVDEFGFLVGDDDSDAEDDTDEEGDDFDDADGMDDDSPGMAGDGDVAADCGGGGGGSSVVPATPCPATSANAADAPREASVPGAAPPSDAAAAAAAAAAATAPQPAAAAETAGGGGGGASDADERPPKQAKLVSGEAKVDAVSAAAKVAAAAVPRKAGVSSGSGSLRAVRTTGKVKTGRATHLPGGATAPISVPMDATSEPMGEE